MKEAFLYDSLVRNLSANLNAVLLQLFCSLFLVFNGVFLSETDLRMLISDTWPRGYKTFFMLN